MIATLYAMPVDEERILLIQRAMEILGAPTLSVMQCEDIYVVIDGAHRLEAARRLRLPVRIRVIAQSTGLSGGRELNVYTLNSDDTVRRI